MKIVQFLLHFQTSLLKYNVTGKYQEDKMKLSVFVYTLCLVISISAQKNTPFRIESGITISHYQAQVKPDVGEPRGERLTNQFEIGLLLSGVYSFTNYFAGGLFFRIDRGERAAASFDRIENGRAITENDLGGVYTELWIGPLLRLHWEYLSFETGYAVVGIRNDDGRRDIYSSKGSNEDAFTVFPGIAWLFAVGSNFPVYKNLDVIIKIEYRPRYYNKRGGDSLQDNIEHGTQSIAPLFGIGWKL